MHDRASMNQIIAAIQRVYKAHPLKFTAATTPKGRIRVVGRIEHRTWSSQLVDIPRVQIAQSLS